MAKKRTVENKTAIKNSVGRIVVFGLLVIAQIIGFIVLLTYLGHNFPPVDIITRAVALIVAVGINGRDHNGVFKLIWVIVILIVPIPGLLFYMLNNFSSSKHKIRRRLEKVDMMVFSHLNYNDHLYEEMRAEDPARASNAKYLRNFNFPIYDGTDIKYYPVAYDCYKDQIEDIKKAKKFVYIEYHAIETKEAFEPLHEALKERAAAGVDCRVLYDDIGSSIFINRNFDTYGDLKGVFTLSEENVETRKKIDEATAQRDIVVRDGKQASADRDAKKEELAPLLTNFQTACWDSTETVRKAFDKTQTGKKKKAQFSEEVLSGRYSAVHHKTEDIQALYDVAYDPKARTYPLFKKSKDVAGRYDLSGIDLLGKAITSSSETDFAKFMKALNATDWVKNGHAAYVGHSKEKCPFYGMHTPERG